MLGTRKRCYICGPMSGFSEYNFPRFRQAKLELQALHPTWIVVSPVDLDELLDGFDGKGEHPYPSHTIFMCRDLPIVAQCDVICLLPGWSKSSGAKAELACAIACGLEIFYTLGAELIEGVTIAS